MQINRSILLFIFLLFIASSCIEEYPIKIEKYENSLIVEGLITNLEGPYEVKLTKTSPLNVYQALAVEGASLTIIDDLGNSVTLTEGIKGVYNTGASGYKGEVGRRYKLMIDYDGQSYTSDFSELKEPVGIADLYFENESRELGFYPYKSYGYQFLVDPVDLQADSNFLYWKMIETYQFNSDFPIDFVYRNYELIEYPTPMEFYTCWRTSSIPNIILAEDIKQDKKNKLEKIPVHYVDNTTNQFAIRYSLLVAQLNIDKNSYFFLKQLSEQNSDDASMYTTQPFQIIGNMHHVSDESIKILGNFTVAGATEKRIFIDRPLSVEFYYSRCKPDYKAMGHLYRLPSPVYVSIEDAGHATAPAPCFDCRLKGGKIEKPDFWID